MVKNMKKALVLLVFSFLTILSSVSLARVELETDIEALLEDNQRQLNNARSWLRSHDEVYKGGNCVKPYVSKTITETSCDSSKEKLAMARCAGPAGCRVIANMFANELEHEAKQFLLSRTCIAAVNELSDQEESTDLEKIMDIGVDMADSLSTLGLRSKYKPVKWISAIVKGGVGVLSFMEFKSCLDEVKSQSSCSDVSSIKWEAIETEDFLKCNRYVEQVSDAQRQISSLEVKLEPIRLVRGYYRNLARKNSDAAIDKWESPSSGKQRSLRNIIRGVEYFKINELGLKNVSYNTAQVLADTTGKQRKGRAENWLVSIDLNKSYGTWKISYIKGISKNGSVPKQSKSKRNAPVNVVKRYFNALNRADVNGAIAKWMPLSSNKKKHRLRGIIENIQWFKINKAELIILDDETSKVFVDVTGKQKRRSPERWTGSIKLEKHDGEWKISELNLTK
jgi:limonene-1,2-epoxide hydrolase/Tfp pilus assembly protein PilX